MLPFTERTCTSIRRRPIRPRAETPARPGTRYLQIPRVTVRCWVAFYGTDRDRMSFMSPDEKPAAEHTSREFSCRALARPVGEAGTPHQQMTASIVPDPTLQVTPGASIGFSKNRQPIPAFDRESTHRVSPQGNKTGSFATRPVSALGQCSKKVEARPNLSAAGFNGARPDARSRERPGCRPVRSPRGRNRPHQGAWHSDLRLPDPGESGSSPRDNGTPVPAAVPRGDFGGRQWTGDVRARPWCV